MKLGGIVMAVLVVAASIYALNYFGIGGGVAKLGVKAS